jgi:hypothetical protein
MTDETHGFDTDILDLLAREKEVEIETWSPDGRARRTIIWLVVADGAPYVRSLRGDRGRWYRQLRLEPHGAVHVAGRRIPIRAVPADDPTLIEACSRGFEKKYGARRADTVAMLQPNTLPTTLRLEPA